MQRQTIDQEFSDSYASQGLQPSSGARPVARNVEVQYGQPTQKRRLRATNDDLYFKNAQQTVDKKSKQPQQKSNVVNFTPPQRRQRRVVPTKRRGKQGVASAVLGEKGADVFLKARATQVTYTTWSWAFSLWLYAYLPIALLSLFFFLLAFAIESLFSAEVAVDPEGGFFSRLADEAFSLLLSTVDNISAAINKVADFFFGINLEALNPINFFFITYVILLAIALLQTLAMYLTYKIEFIDPLGGEQAGKKYGCFLLMFIGYAVPVINIFPWFLPWTLVVWKNPK